MISDEKMIQSAKSIVKSMNLKRGDTVDLRGGIHARELLEEIYIECYRTGAIPQMNMTSDHLATRVMDEIPVETLEQVPRHRLASVKETDCMISIEPYEDPRTTTNFPRDKVQARVKSSVPIRKVIHGEDTGEGKKCCYAGWPTERAASFYGIDYPLLEKFIIEGMTFPLQDLRDRCQVIASRLKGAEKVHLTDPQGTELELHIKGRRLNLDDGFVSEQDIKENDKGNNLPAGEVFVAPHENKGQGKIFCPLTIDRLTGKIIKDVELTIKEGKLQLEDAKASENLDSLVASFQQTMKVDESTQEEVRTLNVAELGIGCNPMITKAIGYVLTDEKIGGSAHVAFGSNFSYGGTSKSSMHWDFVTVPKATIVAELSGGEKRTVIDAGKLPELPAKT